MRTSFRDLIGKLLTSPASKPAAADRGWALALVAAAMAGGWVFAYKLRAFLGLATTSDLYQFTQLATSWLHGALLHDNCYGDHLAIHTYLFCPVLGLLAGPLGAPGLLAAAGIAASASVAAMFRILRALGAPSGAAGGFALLATMMPLSLQVYQDSLYGFHVELLIPAMALWLGYFLLQRHWRGALAMAVALLTVKEDAALIAGSVAAVVVLEDLMRSFATAPSGGKANRWNRAALAVIAISAVAVSLCLLILQAKAAPGEGPSSLRRLRPVNTIAIRDTATLISYTYGHAGQWLASFVTEKWLWLSLLGTFGFILLRPHLLAVGVVTTLVCWLMQDDLLWAPRLAPALAFFQIVGCLAFASVCRIVADLRAGDRDERAGALVLSLLVGLAAGFGLWQQTQLVPAASEVYWLQPRLLVSPAERAKADRLFTRYRREARPDEPVIASPLLFRYAHDRNLFWFDRLANQPQPAWILWDEADVPLAKLARHLEKDAKTGLGDYELIERADRFLLYKRR